MMNMATGTLDSASGHRYSNKIKYSRDLFLNCSNNIWCDLLYSQQMVIHNKWFPPTVTFLPYIAETIQDHLRYRHPGCLRQPSRGPTIGIKGNYDKHHENA